jgi:dTDP-4-dehydrorhamnose 3,5-epimerase
VIFTETMLRGAFILDVEARRDSRGLLPAPIAATSSRRTASIRSGAGQPVVQQPARTLRGMHFQFPPRPKPSWCRCTRGALVDVVVDLRPESPTYLRHVAVELTADNRRSLYVPRRFAHGYQSWRMRPR